MKKPILYIGTGLIALSLISMLIFSSNPGAKGKPGFEKPLEPKFIKEGTLNILSASTQQSLKELDIEIADDEASIEVGMMYRQSMKDSQGMLFIFDKEAPRSFWMRNTYISLDLIFIDAAQKIVTIHRDAKPMSDVSMPSSRDAQYVLEVNGGFCAKYGVAEGDYIEFKKTNSPI